MNKFLHPITDRVSTKKGAWITISIWLLVMVTLSFGPNVNDYKVSNFEPLPEDADSIIAANKIETIFPNEQGTPGILVFYQADASVEREEVQDTISAIMDAEIAGVDSVLDISQLPEPALEEFRSEDQSSFIVPFQLEAELGSKDYLEINKEITEIGDNALAESGGIQLFVTGPAGIAGETVELFERADFVLLIATVIIILFLLISIYRSPLLAFIPLLATGIVFQIANQSLAFLGAGGLEINNQTTSIMSILLFAAVIDYSLFVFSRYREELYSHNSKYDAMRSAMRATAEPVFIAGGTVLLAMLILFFATFREYQNFAPIFGVAIVFIILASITLVPALFTVFGRKAFWPKVPNYGDTSQNKHTFWNKVARFVIKKPGIASGSVTLLLLITSLNIFNMEFEFDLVKNFPEDMPSRMGYEIVENNYDKGEIAPTTLLIENDNSWTEEEIDDIINDYSSLEEVATTSLENISDDEKSIKLSMALQINPYSIEAIEFINQIRDQAEAQLHSLSINGQQYFAGTTAQLADERSVNNRDIVLIVVLETLLILALLVFMTRSLRMASYMMATIIFSYLSALGLGIFLVDVLFGYDAISTRVPIYTFIFSVALGIDYNIILVSRFLEERRKHSVKQSLEKAITHTGGVISSAGVILAATFAALMTMPIADLFVFGFIVSLGVLIDTFLVRGLLLPSLILFFEKDKSHPQKQKEV
ncbi:putative export protein [Bacillus sp. TS-2]|nr:putative export protein [Bacillus sp. TS-2]